MSPPISTLAVQITAPASASYRDLKRKMARLLKEASPRMREGTKRRRALPTTYVLPAVRTRTVAKDVDTRQGFTTRTRTMQPIRAIHPTRRRRIPESERPSAVILTKPS